MGVTAANDRVYGRAGQMPDYQVSSEIFTSPSLQFLQVASITQYYATTTMVRRDQKEMSTSKFGACFVTSSASTILSGNSGVTSFAPQGQNWQPVTFARGWARGGEVYFAPSTTSAPLHLVMAVVVSGPSTYSRSSLV